MDSVKVALRIRPLIATESDSGCRLCIERISGEPQVCVGKGRQYFTFNHVFDEYEGQSDVYDVAVRSLIDNLFKGYNVTILAYGQTGSGKTYTMGTNYDGLGEIGVIPRAIIDIFDIISKSCDKAFKVTVSFLELYNESFYDLFSNKAREQSIVEMRESSSGIYIPGLTELKVTSMEDTLRYLKEGSSGRVTGSTAMNANSSRSHAIFTINISISPKDNPKDVIKSKFQLVDLAGSERSKKTGTSGDRFKEGVNINKGLLELGNVIAQLGEGVNYVNYRNSRLTRLLQDSLGGNSVTLMIACVSPADYNQEETLSTLRYADRAKRIKNKPVVNQDPQSAEIARLNKEIEELRLQIISRGSLCPPEHHLLEQQLLASQQKTGKLSETLDQILKQNMDLHERALLVDGWCDKLSNKLESLINLVESGGLEINSDVEGDPLTEIRNKLNELKNDHEQVVSQIFTLEKQSVVSTCKVTPSTESSGSSEQYLDPVTPGRENHIFAQARITKEIEEISQTLVWKEELISKLSESQSGMVKLQDGSVCQIIDLKDQLTALQQEKEELISQIKLASSGANTPAAKLAEERRVRLEQLEQKHSQLLKRVAEQEKIIKMKEKSDKKIADLRCEVQLMKQMKVKLIHDLRNENNRYRALRNEKDREMLKLRTQNVKSQNKLIRLEQQYSLQHNVLKRKLEAAAAANKRIMEALERQRKGEKKSKVSQAERICEMINEELEVLVSAFNAETSLDSLIQDRTALKKQMAAIKERLEDSEVSADQKNTLMEDIKQCQEAIDMRSVQIADLQQKILDARQENRGKSRWDVLQSMADAKFALSHLFDMIADLKKEIINKDALYNELKETEEALLKEKEKTNAKFQELSTYYNRRLNQLEREYEEKIYLLLKQSKNEGHSDRILEQELEKMGSLRQEVAQLQSKVAEYEAQLAGKVQVSSFQEAYDVFLMESTVDNKPSTPSNILSENNGIDATEKGESENVLDRTFTCSAKGSGKRSLDTMPEKQDEANSQAKEDSEGELKKRRFGYYCEFFPDDEDESPESKRKRLEKIPFYGKRSYFD